MLIKFLQEQRTIGLSIFRVLLSVLIIRNALSYLPLANTIFGKEGIAPFVIYERSFHGMFPGVLYPFEGVWDAKMLLLLTIGLAFLFLLGIGRGFTGMLLWLCLVIFFKRNIFIMDGSDNVMMVALPFLSIAESYNYQTIKFNIRYKFGFWKKPVFQFIREQIRTLALLGFLLQIALIYLSTGIEKVLLREWQSGTALYYALRLEEFIDSSWNIPLTQSALFVYIGTYASLLFDLSFGILVWFRKLRLWMVLWGISFHVGIWFFMGLDAFSFIMISTYFVFFTNNEYIIGWSFIKAKWTGKKTNNEAKEKYAA